MTSGHMTSYDMSFSAFSTCIIYRLTNCQGLALTIKELPILSRGKSEKYCDVKE